MKIYKITEPDRDVLDFARAIGKAVLFDELKTWTTSRWWPLQKKTKDERIIW